MDKNSIKYDQEEGILYCQGDWRVANLGRVEEKIRHLPKITQSPLKIDGSGLSELDSGGAFLIYRLMEQLKHDKINTELVNFADQHERLFALLQEKMAAVKKTEKPEGHDDAITYVGKQPLSAYQVL